MCRKFPLTAIIPIFRPEIHVLIPARPQKRNIVKNKLALGCWNYARAGFYIITIPIYLPLSLFMTITIFTIIFHITSPDAVPAGSTDMIGTLYYALPILTIHVGLATGRSISILDESVCLGG